MKILVFCSVLPRFFGLLCREIARREPQLRFSAVVLSLPDRDKAVAAAPDLAWDSLSVFSDALRADGLHAPPDLKYLAALERRYGRPNLQSMVAADWYVSHYACDRGWRFLEIAFRFLLAEMDRQRPDLVVAEGVDCTPSHVLHAICAARNIPFLFSGGWRLPGRVSFIDNAEDRWEEAERLYAEYQTAGILPESAAAARAYIEGFRSAGRSDLVWPNRQRLYRPSDLRFFLSFVRNRMRDPQFYISLPPLRAARQRFTRMARAHLQSRYCSPGRAGEGFVVYPLQTQPEMSVETLAPQFADQPALIGAIARALPVGYRVYVKEHPFALGARRLQEYRRIAQIPNCRIIAVETDVRQLLHDSAGVATITSTMGLEALLMERPAITFGRPFYDASGLTYPVRDLYDLPRTLHQAIHAHAPDQRRLIDFIAAALDASHPGEIGYEGYSTAAAFEPANVAAVADALLHTIRRHARTQAHGTRKGQPA